MKSRVLQFLLFVLPLGVSAQRQNADMIIYNATVYTVDPQFNVASAIAVSKGRIVGVGASADLLRNFNALQQINAEGKFIYPGFIDAHAHFFEYCLGLQT